MLSKHDLQAPEWAKQSCRSLSYAVTLILVCSIAYCYLLATLNGTETSLGLSIFWGSADWALWLVLPPVLVQQISGNQGLNLTDRKSLFLAFQATLWMPVAAILLRCAIELLMTDSPYLLVLSLAYKRAPVYLTAWLLMLAFIFWKKHLHNKTTSPEAMFTYQTTPTRHYTLVVQSSHGEHVVRLDDIRYLKACGNYLEVKVQDTVYLMRATMKALETVLAGSALVRCHRSFFVNLSYVLSIEYAATGNHDIVLNSGEKIPVSKSFREQFRAQYRQSGGATRIG